MLKYRIRLCPFFPLSSTPVSMVKKMVVGKFIKQNFILKILVLEITSKKILLIFLFIRYDTAIIKQSSSYFLGKNFLISLILQALNEVSQSNIFLVFFLYIWLFKVNSILIIIGISYLFSKLNINWFLLFFIVSFKLLLLNLIKVMTTGLPLANFFNGIYETLCVFPALITRSGNSNVNSVI